MQSWTNGVQLRREALVMETKTFNIGSGKRARTTRLSFGILLLCCILEILENYLSYRKRIMILPIHENVSISLSLFNFLFHLLRVLRLRNRSAKKTSQSSRSSHMVSWGPTKLRFLVEWACWCWEVCSSSLFFVKISR